MQSLVNNQLSIFAEHNIPLGSIKYVGMTNLRDDWFCLGIGSAQAPDPLLSCVFKTELITRMRRALRSGLDIRFGPTIEYSKKPGKIVVVKSKKDPNIPRDDVYKSSTIHVGPGEPPGSVSKPTPKGKQVAAKPITTGRLLRPGGPKGGPAMNRPTAPRPIPQEPRAIPQPQAQPLVTANPVVAAAASAAQQRIPTAAAVPAGPPARNASTASSRPPPPPPPPPQPQPAASAEPTCKAKYDFAGTTDKELSVSTGEIVVIIRKEGNGWWLVKRLDSSTQGWAPSAYLEEIITKKVAPPPPRRPNGIEKKKPPAPPKRPGVAGTPDRNSAAGNSSSGASTSGESFAGGLAEAVGIPSPRTSRDANCRCS